MRSFTGRERRIETALLLAVLALAAGLRLWRLEDHGFGNPYYAAAVRSMTESAHLFFYNAFDPAGFLSLDKPPVAFWIQSVFALVLGYSGWVLHLPQVLAGVASVAILYHMVRRDLGPSAGLIAGLLLAITPIAVAVDRSNNTESWLTFFLLLAAWAALRGRGRSLAIAMALLGVAFNVKMLAAFACGPALLAGWLMASPPGWWRRLGWMTVSAVVLGVVSLSYAVAYDLIPASHRPHVASSSGNSMLELIVVHNGIERFDPTSLPNIGLLAYVKLYDKVPVGPFRLATPMLAGQVGWLAPLALLGVLAWRRRDGGAAPLALWGIWALTYGIVYSVAGGIFHAYYLSTMAPPLAALAGVACVDLWRRGPGWLALGLAATAAWQAYLVVNTLGWQSAWLGLPLVVLLAAAAMPWRARHAAAALAGAALFALPLAWSLSAVLSPGNLALPSASLPRALGLNDGRGPILSRDWPPLTDDPKLVDFLLAHRGGARFIAATPTQPNAASLIIRSGQPVLAFGGFYGVDRLLSVEQLQDMARRSEIRYAIVSTVDPMSPVTEWVLTTGTLVPETQWSSRRWDANRSLLLYDLKSDQADR
jgi:4-amino-4-deoxy-L-arabinose transferase-like glycosyltransferase